MGIDNEEGWVPDLGDPSWKVEAASMRTFLSNPRDWNALVDWARSRGIGKYKVRHMLAYLDMRGEARWENGTWRLTRRRA